MSFLISPITLTFLIVTIGIFLGRIKMFNVSLGLSSTLIVAVICGYLLDKYDLISDLEIQTQFISNMKFFTSLGTSIFVSVIGLSAGYMLDFKNKNILIAFTIGSVMIILAFATVKVISLFDTDITISTLFGILCGSLTTTPGLSAVCELENINADEAVLGYAGAYIFGTVLTVLSVQFITRKIQKEQIIKPKLTTSDSYKRTFEDLIQIAIVIVLGRILGDVEIPIVNFSFGTSGGILCCGILIGTFIKKNFADDCLSKEIQGVLRELGLVLFFVGNGITAGLQISSGFTIKSFIYGIVFSVIPITVGFLLSKAVFKNNKIDIATIISGGMTSTPAIGVLSKNQAISLDKYSSAYVGALITIVIAINVLGGLFLK